MKSHNKFWLFMIIAGVGLGSSAMAYTQFTDTPEALAQNENAVATQPPEEDAVEENEAEGDDADESDDDEWMEGEEGDEEGDGDEMMEEGDDQNEEVGDNPESEMSDDSESSSDENAEMEPEQEPEQEQDNPEESFEERTHSIVDEINEAKDNKDVERVAELKQQLTEVVNEHFQWLESKRQAQVEALELRLDKLKKLLKVRSTNADKIIDRRVRSLLNEPDALDWKIK